MLTVCILATAVTLAFFWTCCEIAVKDAALAYHIGLGVPWLVMAMLVLWVFYLLGVYT